MAKDGPYITGSRRKEHPGYVYLIRSEHGQFKIGCTTSINSRMVNFGGAKVPFYWELLHTIECTNRRFTERMLHRLFKDKHCEGEWYDLDEDDVCFIRSIRQTIDPWPLMTRLAPRAPKPLPYGKRK